MFIILFFTCIVSYNIELGIEGCNRLLKVYYLFKYLITFTVLASTPSLLRW